jgi:LDH2 family malate/lactate/ureidoglycolate dehydrogenase
MPKDQSEGTRLVRIDDLRRCLGTAFERLQLTPDDAEGLGALLLDSELRGHPDHGAQRSGFWPPFTATAS